MKCPYCGESGSHVLEKRETPDGLANRRRRECLKCSRRWTTYEKSELPELLVIKKDGRREQFSESKLKSGLFKACEKRPVSAETIDDLAVQIESELREESSSREVSSSLIGEKVMAKLRRLDPVAYIRFASVYRAFADVAQFENELVRLRKKRRKKLLEKK